MNTGRPQTTPFPQRSLVVTLLRCGTNLSLADINELMVKLVSLYTVLLKVTEPTDAVK